MSLLGIARGVRPFLPDGRSLSEVDWRARHAVMSWILAGHVPAVFMYALLRDAGLEHAVLEAALPAGILSIAVFHGGRRVRSVSVAFGLITCSAIFVHLSGGLIEWHFHYFVTLALVALYQEWLVYLMALAFVVVQHALGSWLSFHSVYNHGNGELWWAAVHGAFVLAASACHVASWRFSEIATARADGYRRELHEGEQSLMAQLEQTAQIRSDLIATASHEFRTPLTAIGGAAVTLQRHGDQLSAEQRAELLAAIIARSDRLGQMLESMLIAAEVAPPEFAATSLREVIADVLTPSRHGDRLTVDVPSDLWIACGRRPLGQLVERLVDSARLKGDSKAAVQLTARADSDDVFLVASVPAAGLDGQGISGLFEPFRGGTDAVPRSADVGLGLYAVRRIAEVHGGSTEVSLEDGAFVIEVRLPRAVAEVPAQRETIAAQDVNAVG